MIVIIAITLFTIFLFLSCIHFYWAFGGHWGVDSVLPAKSNNEKIMQPGLFATIMVALVLLTFALFILIKAGLLQTTLPTWLQQYGLYILASLFIIRAIGDFKYVGFTKKLKGTKFALMDTKWYSPLCLGIGILLILLQCIS
jgi:Protein of unknown function (DUF3995)